MKRFFISCVGVMISTVMLAQTADNHFETLKNLDIYTDVIKELSSNYVDEIQPGEITKTGIDAMLGSLDPYTNFIPEAEVEDYKFMTTGQYGGIGALIHQQDGYVVISEPYENSPAHKSGLLPGDCILEVNRQSAEGKTYDEVSAVLKGEPGTTVELKLSRFGSDTPIVKNITREIIKIDNIPYYGSLNNDIGYIKLTGFTQNAGREVKQAFLKLKEQKSLNGLIIDLRGNGGGLLNEAVDLCNIFVERGQEIVSTRGRIIERNQSHLTLAPPADLKIPVVILVDQLSASASEIVAGALQDLDRAVIIGQRTFGKGLVQNVVPLSYNAQMKITIAKYYIPSGRCIQAIDYSHKNGNGLFTKIPDSLIREFTTANGRKVYDGGGISPDISMKPKRYSQIATTLYRKYLIFDFANQFYLKSPSILPAKDFRITDSIYSDFLSFIAGKDYSYISRSEEALDRLKSQAEKDDYFDAIREDYERMKKQMLDDKKDDINKYRDQIEELLTQEIVTRYYYQKGKVEASLAGDPEVEMAVQTLLDIDKYASILSGSWVQPEEESVTEPLPEEENGNILEEELIEQN